LLVLSAITSAVETVLFGLRDHHIAGLSREDRRLEALLRLFLRNSEEKRIRVLVLIAILNLGLIVTGLILLDLWDWSMPAVIGLMFVIVMVGDLAPKAIAMAYPALMVRWFARPFLQLSPCLQPMARYFVRISGAIEKLITPKTAKLNTTYTEDEYSALLDIQKEEGTITEDERSIIAEIVKLGNRTAKDCMTSRVDAFGLPNGLSRDEMLQKLRDTSLWKVPLYRESMDSITGVLDVRKLLEQPNVAAAISPPVFVPETMAALNVFSEFLREPHSLVVVLDEYGGTEGVLTHDDILEEVFGAEAGEAEGEEQEFTFIGKDRLKATGSARIEDVCEALDVELEAEGVDTIGGLVFNKLGYLPLPGERVEIGPFRIVVRRIGKKKRIEELLVEKLPAAS